jgi:hypothetical protein
MEAIKALPFVGHNELSDEEKQYIQKSDTPLEIVDILIQKPVSKSFAEYPAFVESAVQDINTKADELLNEYNPVNAPDGKIGDKTQGECIDKIKEFIRETESDEDKKTALANKLFNSLNGSNLIGTGHEKAVVEYVAGIDEANRDQAIAYSIYKAREALKAEVKEAANGLRKSLLGVAQIDLIKTDGVEFKKDGQDIPIKKLLEKAANSGRLQRAAKRYVMKLLKGGDAAATVSGKGNLQAMAAMLGSMDQETFTLIGQIMGSTMAEIESEHNFNPEFWAGTISRGWNKFTSYPADAFFAVIDFFAIVFEYIGEYVTRGAYKAYEGVRGVTEDQKRQDQDIFKQADVDTAMGELVKSLKEVNISTVISTDKDQLRDAIVVFLKDNTNSKDLKEKLTTVGDGIGGGELKTAIGKLTTQTVLTQHKKDLQAILDMPEMNQNASNALPSWAKAAKAVNVLKLAK